MSNSLSAGWRYRGLSRLLSPILIVHAIWKSAKTNNARFLRERLGFAPKMNTPVSWWHAASVGEIQTIWPLLQAHITSVQGQKIDGSSNKVWLITTNTTTGYEVLQQRLKKSQLTHCVQHAYFPIDTPGISGRFFRRINPAHLVNAETEIWPNLFTTLINQSVPITIVNARVTAKTLGTIDSAHPLAKTLRPAYQNALSNVTVLSRNNDEAKGYLQLGAADRHVHVVGDLKFADNRPLTCTPPLMANAITQPYVVAASTHPSEENVLCKQWLQQASSGLLVIAPRHVERGPALYAELKQQYGDLLAPLRSQGGEPNKTHRLYLADTLGELHDWYSGAAAAFVGGSLIKRGGHNVLEPFFHSVPVVTGPHTDNFIDAVNWLKEKEAIYQAADATDAVAALIQLSQSVTSTPAQLQNDLLANYLEHLPIVQ